MTDYLGVTFLGWIDLDRKRPAAVKLAAACERHRQKFGTEPTVCLTSPETAAALGDAGEVRVEARGHIARNTFLVGRDG